MGLGTTFTESGVVAVSMIGGLIKIDDDASRKSKRWGRSHNRGNRYESG